MYKVVLHKLSGGADEYSTPSLHYAKRYADLYKTDYQFIEIFRISEEAEEIIETFGSKI